MDANVFVHSALINNGLLLSCDVTCDFLLTAVQPPGHELKCLANRDRPCGLIFF